jgi:hypothetical protein
MRLLPVSSLYEGDVDDVYPSILRSSSSDSIKDRRILLAVEKKQNTHIIYRNGSCCGGD